MDRNYLILLFLLTGCFNQPGIYQGALLRYRVAEGDKLEGVAQRFGISTGGLQTINRLDDTTIKAGQELLVPFNGQDPGTPISGARGLISAMQEIFGSTKVRLGEAKRYVHSLSWPIARSEAKTVSNFGARWRNFHEGLDLAAAPGTRVYAVQSGEVVYAGEGLRNYGKIVVIKGGSLMTIYAHNSSLEVRTGQSVTSGDFIAEVGATGNAESPHLHFETRVRTPEGLYAAVDPLLFLEQ